MFRDEVMTRYAEALATMDRTEFEDFLNAETARLTQQATVLQTDLEDQLKAQAQARLGRPLEYLETAGVVNQARQQALDMVRTQLWDGYLPPDDAAPGEPEPELTEVSAETEALVERVWPTASPAWQVSAELIVQARLADGLPVPTGPDHPLARTLAELVEQDVAHDAEVLAQARRSSNR